MLNWAVILRVYVLHEMEELYCLKIYQGMQSYALGKVVHIRVNMLYPFKVETLIIPAFQAFALIHLKIKYTSFCHLKGRATV